MLYCIVAKSGAGKDYVVDQICKTFGMSRVISRTTRTKRNDKDNRIFVSQEQADREYHKAIAKTVFDGHRNYVLREDIQGKDIFIVDPNGVSTLKQHGVQCRTIYIDVVWYKRMYNMLFRRKDKLFNVIMRLIHDRSAFKNFYADIHVDSTQEAFNLFHYKII